MKEYLNKLTDGTYKLVVLSDVIDGHDGLIEIPEGATKLVSHNYVHLPIMFVKPCANGYSYYYPKKNWSDNILSDIKGRNVFWSRYTHPEELPFVDDEPSFEKHVKTMKSLMMPCMPKPSLNEQYAEIEARKEYKLKNDMSVDDYINSLRCEDTVNHPSHNHYFIDVSDVDEIDFYEIALRYNVTDPCIQHILKKCLAVGNRGHKDFHTDLKDIYDTAARALRIHGG